MSIARLRLAWGVFLSAAVCISFAECYLRWFPPRDLHAFLGEQCPQTGPYAPDEDFTVGYRSWDDFCHENAGRLTEYMPFQSTGDARPLWAFFGNSFVQAPGMLADHARANLIDHRVFNLGKNEQLYLRFAQIKALLSRGMLPERIFIALMPVDVIGLGKQPLSTLYVTKQGAVTFQCDRSQLLLSSRVGLTAAVRIGWARGNPGFNQNKLYDGIDEPLLSDIQRLFGRLMSVTRRHHVPVTVLLIPAYHQIWKKAGFGFQDTLSPILRDQGFDVFDPREAFCNQSNLEGLFIPDKHFSPRGNLILLTQLVKHVRGLPAPADAVAGAP